MRIHLIALAILAASSSALAMQPQVLNLRASDIAHQLPDSLRLKMLAAMARGDIAGAIALYELEMGAPPPAWLTEIQAAYNVVNQRAGPCLEVAEKLKAGFEKLGQPAEIVKLTTGMAQGPAAQIGIQLGSQVKMLSQTGIHYAVQVNNKLYDAWTGPLGQTVEEYMHRLHPGMAAFQIKLIR